MIETRLAQIMPCILVLQWGLQATATHQGQITCDPTDVGELSITLNDPTPDLCDLYYVQLALPGKDDSPYALVTTKDFPVTVVGLSEDITYSVSIRCHDASTPSIAWGPSWGQATESTQCSTAAQVPLDYNIETSKSSTPLTQAAADSNSSSFLRVYRISEYSFDVDFLENHDAASADAMPLYLMTCSPGGTCSPWSVDDTTPRWSECQSFLANQTSCGRGTSFDCMSCLDDQRDAVTNACGEWSDQDTLEGEGSYSVHWYCGVGWPESTPQEGPITEYCIEYVPLSSETTNGVDHEKNTQKEGGADDDDDAFAVYLSCNSDEVDAFGNDPRDPSCICICYDDRLLSHQSFPEIQRDCAIVGNHDDDDGSTLPWVNETSCNCPGTASPLPDPDGDRSPLTHIGRTPLYLPYVGVPMEPHGPHPGEELTGYNYHFPKAGACPEGQPLGFEGCTWRRLPLSRMIYGDDLEANGWDRTFVQDTPGNVSHTKANIAAFGATFKALDGMVLPITCGSELH